MKRDLALPWLGIIGGGQLGALMAEAALKLGYRVRVLDPNPACTARSFCDELITADFDDVVAAEKLARGCVAVTVDLEKVGIDALSAASRHAPCRPSPELLATIQDRIAQKGWLDKHEIPIAPWFAATTRQELDAALDKLADNAFVKAAFGGYDGKGQARVRDASDRHAAYELVDRQACVVETPIAFIAEISVQVARRPGGESAVFPPALNHHVNQILEWTLLPAPIPDDIAEAARELADKVARAFDAVGLLTVEMFLLEDGTLLVNELAPRPHNSFHTTLIGSATSQFEQAVRAVCDLPLGATDTHGATIVANLLGELWLNEAPFNPSPALAFAHVHLHLYGKQQARPGRKMGHITTWNAAPQRALELARDAMSALGGELGEPTLPAFRIRNAGTSAHSQEE